jgi:S-adenosylmethionine synthetase
MNWIKRLWRHIWHSKKETFVDDYGGERCDSTKELISMPISDAKKLFSRLSDADKYVASKIDENIDIISKDEKAFIHLVYHFDESEHILWYSGCTKDINIRGGIIRNVLCRMYSEHNYHVLVLGCSITIRITGRYYRFPYRIEYKNNLYNYDQSAKIKIRIGKTD